MNLLKTALVALVILLLLAAALGRNPSSLAGKGWEVAVQVEGRLYPQTICRDPEVDQAHRRIICHRRRVAFGELP